MSTRTGKSSIDRRTAERLLRGGRGAGDDPLASLLVAAKAPGRDGELAHEEVAVAAFRAHRASVPEPQRRSMIKSVVAKLLTVKVAALAATVAGVGGVALAASTGTIPTPLHGPSAAASHRPDNDQGKPSDRPTGRSSDRRDPAAVPSDMPPGLYWLCHEYIGRDADQRGKALGESKFRELADRAGGQDRDKADQFCDKLLNDRPDGAASAHPTGPPDRTKDPGQAKPSQAADRPANRPSGQPSTHPTR